MREPTDPFLAAAAADEAREDRSLTAAEMAWMSDRVPAATAPAAEAAEAAEAEEPARATEPRGPGLLRVVLAAVILGLAGAGAAWLLWPGARAKAPAAPPAVAVAEPPRPSPQPPPPPPPPAAPEPAPAPEPVAAPAPPPAPPAHASQPPASAASPQPAPPPAPAAPPASPAPSAAVRTASAARFEPGAVTVAPSRQKPSHALSSKDRKLLDLLARKGDEAAPPEPVEKLDLDTGAALDPAAVGRVVQESQGAFSGCITRAARDGSGPATRRTILLVTVAPSGGVTAAALDEPELARAPLGRCILNAARRLVFPSFEGAPVDVSVPLLLEAR